MDSPSSSAAALKLEIARLAGAINRHKTGQVPSTSGHPPRSRNNVYVNPNYKLPSSSNLPAATVAQSSQSPESGLPPTSQKRDVVIGGVAFEASGRSLVRKDLAKQVPPRSTEHPTHATRGHLRTKPHRIYKPRGSAHRGRPVNRNMTLNSSRKAFQSRRISSKRSKVNKPCPRFTTTGACNRGLTCVYQHDPSKIAICWNFLQGNCPNTAETCALSHDPSPERTPLCVHFANNGRCTRTDCPFPHVRVGKREGVCRDFAVLGYCEKGLDCDQQHVRECPDFAEKGVCTTKGCKLPHVIRANRNRKAPTSASLPTPTTARSRTDAPDFSATSTLSTEHSADASSNNTISAQLPSAEDAQLGDEFISLTFHESDSEDDDEEDDNDNEENEDEDEDSSEHEELDEFTAVSHDEAISASNVGDM